MLRDRLLRLMSRIKQQPAGNHGQDRHHADHDGDRRMPAALPVGKVPISPIAKPDDDQRASHSANPSRDALRAALAAAPGAGSDIS